jgi:hypothetical protein
VNVNEELSVVVEQDAETDGGHLPKDPFLAILVQGVDKHPGFELGVTLHVNGVIISGVMCSMPSYFAEQADIIRQIGSASDAENREGFAKMFDWLSEESRARPRDTQADDGEANEAEQNASDLPAFIHLRAATVHAPGTNAVLPATLWRGRLDHVSGWSIGNFVLEPPRVGAAID